ncbi:hypothetical protein FraQA3DRAFT_1538 [Frankia sp. QA3]|nr:hypothetical protein FraQA3DRAFT_1538 [Frankia sp. QA3]
MYSSQRRRAAVSANARSRSRPAAQGSPGQKPDLDRRVARIVTWAARRNLAVGRVVTEVGSALNGHRRKFLGLLRDPAVTTIVVEHRDGFARFGAEYVEAALSAQGRRLLVVDPAEVDDDLVGDITEILTSMCAGPPIAGSSRSPSRSSATFPPGRRGASARVARSASTLG